MSYTSHTLRLPRAVEVAGSVSSDGHHAAGYEEVVGSPEEEGLQSHVQSHDRGASRGW